MSIYLLASLTIPIYFLFRKAGFNPVWSLATLLPLILYIISQGILSSSIVIFSFHISLTILALRAWPNKEETPNPVFFYDTRNIFIVLVYLLIPIFSIYTIFKKFRS